MGQYHLTVNLDKKEYLNPHKVGDGLKLVEQIESTAGIGSALIILCACSNGRGGGDIKGDNNVIGRWAGDRIAIIGDYTEDGDIPGVDTVSIKENLEKTYMDISDLVRPIIEEVCNI